VRVGTQAPIRHQHISGCSHRVPLVHLGQVVGQEGRDDPLEEPPGARMEQPQKVGHGEAAPRPLHVRLAECRLSRRGIGHRAARAIDQDGAMPLPPPFIGDVRRRGSAEAGQQEPKAVEGKSGTGLAVGRCAAPPARELRHMTARGVAVQPLS